jgi:hypothetical protein
MENSPNIFAIFRLPAAIQIFLARFDGGQNFDDFEPLVMRQTATINRP